MTLLRSYGRATKPTAGPAPGAKAFMQWVLANFAVRGGKNLGIYVVRTVAGSSTTSLHAEGRACDLGINPHGAQWGTEFAEQLRLNSAELGVQCVIWNGRIWSGAYPDAGWRAYTGTNAHVDHIHCELTRAAAKTLTAQRIQAVLRPTALRAAAPPAAPAEDEMTPAQLNMLRQDIGFARDQIMTALGVHDPVNAPNKLTPDELAAIAVARRVDVGFARDQILAKLAEPVPAPEQGDQLAAIVRTLEDLGRRVAALESKAAP